MKFATFFCFLVLSVAVQAVDPIEVARLFVQGVHQGLESSLTNPNLTCIDHSVTIASSLATFLDIVPDAFPKADNLVPFLVEMTPLATTTANIMIFCGDTDLGGVISNVFSDLTSFDLLPGQSLISDNLKRYRTWIDTFYYMCQKGNYKLCGYEAGQLMYPLIKKALPDLSLDLGLPAWRDKGGCSSGLDSRVDLVNPNFPDWLHNATAVCLPQAATSAKAFMRCMMDKLEAVAGLLPACASCFAFGEDCLRAHCASESNKDLCFSEMCEEKFWACSGLPDDFEYPIAK